MKTLIQNISIVNEGRTVVSDVLIQEDVIAKIGNIDRTSVQADEIIDGTGLHLFPGVIDDQVHFREPGLTYKGEIATEAKAAVAGGVTSFMEMPNTNPQTLTQDLLEQKYQRASEVSLANYSFFMGASNDNRDEVLKTNPKNVCGIKVFMGSSTGNMLVDNKETLRTIFSEAPCIVATHCEDEATVRANLEHYTLLYGEQILPQHHPLIRSEEACYRSSSMAVELAEKYNTKLHILHISTAKETSLFRNDIPLREKKITAEACVHHLWFSDEDYLTKGNFIKWNPAVKAAKDRDAILEAVLSNRIDVIATDHAPHTLEEKQKPYLEAPSGGPLVQHSLVAMLELYHRGKITLERIAEKMSHAVADLFQIEKRGYVREGYKADVVLVDLHRPWMVQKENLYYKCAWSPFMNETFQSQVVTTFVNGHKVYHLGTFNETQRGERLTFDR
jgi:dihydroorotase